MKRRMGSSGQDADPASKGAVRVNPVVVLQTLSQLATSKNPPNGAIRILLSSFHFEKSPTTKTKRSHGDKHMNDGRKQSKHGDENSLQCDVCHRSYSNKSNLDRHVEKSHPAKRRRLIETALLECEECHKTYAFQADLEAHMDSHSSNSEPKSPKYKCDFCNKERANIYMHYASLHRIDNPEQIMFENGRVLVHSTINPDGGKAKWFLKEKEKMNLYKDFTCRLCENEVCFDSQEILESHYTIHHAVEPVMQGNIKRLFRAKKAAHLIDLPTSQNPKRKRSNMATLVQEKSPSRPVNGAKKHNECASQQASKNLQVPAPDISSSIQEKNPQPVHAEKKDCSSQAVSQNSQAPQPDVSSLVQEKTSPQVNEADKGSESASQQVTKNSHLPEAGISSSVQENTPSSPVQTEKNSECGSQQVSPQGSKTKETASKPKKYNCAFCNKLIAPIYRHYGIGHQIEYPEDILFVNGNVLVFAGIYTNGGQAPWFQREKKNAENKYTESTCRLCDTEFDSKQLLEKHYRIEHKVDPDVIKLDDLQCLFRARKGAHLTDLPPSGALKRQQPTNKSRLVKRRKEKTTNKGTEADIVIFLNLYQCAACGVAATTCDASIHHAQHHHYKGHRPALHTCNTCKLAFEPQCFTNHCRNHLSRNKYKIVKFDPSKLLHEWTDLFEGLSENHAERIKSSSIYQHTRRVKMNWLLHAGILMYQCAKCDMNVPPQDVESHCYNFKACVKNPAPAHFCSHCKISFYTSVALTEHERQHKQFAPDYDCFKKVTFNCKEDEAINKALQSLQCPEVSLIEESRSDNTLKKPAGKSPVETQQRNVEEGNETRENVVESAFCVQRNKSILVTEHEAHAALHKSTLNQNAVEHTLQTEGCNQSEMFAAENCNKKGDRIGNVPTQTKTVDTESNVGGTVEPWNSDNDSCCSLQISTSTVEVQVHIANDNAIGSSDKEQNENNAEENARNEATTINTVLSQGHDDMDCPEFSEEMTNDLKREIEYLGHEAFGTDDWVYIPNVILPANDSLETKKEETEKRSEFNNNELGGDITDRNQYEREAGSDNISQDMFTNDSQMVTNESPTYTQIAEHINNFDGSILTRSETQMANDNCITIYDSDDDVNGGLQNDNQECSRPSSRRILCRMLSQD